MNKYLLYVLVICLSACGSSPTKRDSPETEKRISERELKVSHKACDSDYERGYCVTLGIWYEEGVRVDQSYETAARLYQMACERMEGKWAGGWGCFQLGQLLNNADYAKRNTREAKKYHKAGCDAGYDMACEQFAILDAARHATYLNKNAEKQGVIAEKSGLQIEVLKHGAGQVTPPLHGDLLLHIKSQLSNGTALYASPIHLRDLKHIPIPSLTKSIQTMTTGDVFRFHVPPHLRANLPRYYKDWLGLDKAPLTDIVILDIEVVKVIPEKWDFESTQHRATASIETVDYNFKDGALKAQRMQTFSITYDRNVGDLGEWRYWVTTTRRRGSDQSQMTLIDARIQPDGSPPKTIKAFNENLRYSRTIDCEIGKNCVKFSFPVEFNEDILASIETAEKVEGSSLDFRFSQPTSSKRLNTRIATFNLEGFSDAVAKVQKHTADYASIVDKHGPLLKYKRFVSAFSLPVSTLDCSLNKEQLAYYAPAYNLTNLDTYYQGKINEQEKCLNHGIHKNYTAIKTLVHAIDGSWMLQKTAGNLAQPQWTVPEGCPECKKKVNDVVNQANNIAASAATIKKRTSEDWLAVRPQIIESIKSNMTARAAYENYKRAKDREESDELRAREKALYRSLKNQPSELESFSRAVGNTARKIDRQIKEKEKRELETLIYEAELNKKVRQKTDPKNSGGSNFHLKSECANKDGQRASDREGQICRWSCPANSCNCTEVCQAASTGSPPKKANKAPLENCPPHHCMRKDPTTGVKICSPKRDEHSKCHVLK